VLTKTLPWADAAGLRLCLLTPEMHNRSIVDAAFGPAAASIQPAIETNSILTLGLSVLVGDVSSILPGALVDVLRSHGELEAVPLDAPVVLTPIGFMFATTDRPALAAALAMARDDAWLEHLAAHTGLKES
jgi:DNA-binding transcriptional LysR family regulator